MRCLRLISVALGASLAAVSTARAVYAPISEVEKGRLLTSYLLVGSYFDTNIFGGPSEERSSWVSYVSPQVAVNWNPRKQMLLAWGSGLRWDSFDRRPGNRDLLSYNSNLRVAYTVNPRVEVELSALYALSRNPESLLPGTSTLLVQDQSREDWGLDGRLRWTLSPRTGMILKLKGEQFYYRDDTLAVELDRREFLSSGSWTYLWRPRSRAVMEHRAQIVRYRYNAPVKDKESQLLLLGLDYTLGRSLGLTSRLGGEWRQRNEGVVWRPYAEVGGRWDYARSSYLSAGYAYVIEEVANVATYNDLSVHRFFLNLQHSLTAKLLGGLAAGWEPGLLNTRREIGPRLDETTWKLGASLEYRLRPRATLLLTSDYDDVQSDDEGRGLRRMRTGLSVRIVF